MRAQEAHARERRTAFKLLYDSGWSDLAISRVLTVSPSTISRWRSCECLPPNPSVYLQKIDHDIATEMYRKGASDGQIAIRFGATQSGVTRWRQRHCLSPNFDGVQPFDRDTRRKAKKMLCRGAARFQVAEEFGVGALTTISKWRRKIRDPGLRRAGLTNSCIRKQVLRDLSVQERIRKALGRGLPEEVRDEAAMSMYVDALDGRLLVELIEREAPSYRAAAFAICGSNYGPRSLDDEIEDGWSLHETIDDPRALQAFDHIFEDNFS